MHGRLVISVPRQHITSTGLVSSGSAILKSPVLSTTRQINLRRRDLVADYLITPSDQSPKIRVIPFLLLLPIHVPPHRTPGQNPSARFSCTKTNALAINGHRLNAKFRLICRIAIAYIPVCEYILQRKTW